MATEQERIAGEELARRAMDDVRMKAKREFTQQLRDNLAYSIEMNEKLARQEPPRRPDWMKEIRDLDSWLSGQRYALAYLQSVLDNEVNWRTL
jgi:hypothetical protein